MIPQGGEICKVGAGSLPSAAEKRNCYGQSLRKKGTGVHLFPRKMDFGGRSILPHLSGSPLVVPSACSRYEIYYLKVRSYSMFSIAEILGGVNLPIDRGHGNSVLIPGLGSKCPGDSSMRFKAKPTFLFCVGAEPAPGVSRTFLGKSGRKAPGAAPLDSAFLLPSLALLCLGFEGP
jgi:hypothetical protein